MIEHLEDLLLHLRSVHLLLHRQILLVHHLHRVEARIIAILFAVVGAPQAAEVHGADIAGADPADQPEVAECKARLPTKRGGADGRVGEVRRPVRLQREIVVVIVVYVVVFGHRR